MTAERDERLMRGAQGERGARGERGPGMRLPVRAAMASLFVLMFALAGANLLWSAHLVNENHAQRCAAITQVARIRLLPDAGALNPSRQAINTIIMSDRRRAANLHCG